MVGIVAARKLSIRGGMSRIRWWHRIDLGGGIVTPGADNSPEKLKTLHMPHDLRGWTVLDVGAWDGFFSFEAERRGAKKVLATDSYCWEGKGKAAKDGFLFARKVLGSNVKDKKIDVLDLSPKTVGVYDLVLFLGVLYHMRDPMLALEKVSSVTKKMLILETFTDLNDVRRPAAAFYPGGELEGDKTNWWGPNQAAVEGMLKAVGFKRLEKVYEHPPYFRLGRAAKMQLTGKGSFFTAIKHGRVVYHAWK